jgi:tetratricopeptide (TPR) repeat protein
MRWRPRVIAPIVCILAVQVLAGAELQLRSATAGDSTGPTFRRDVEPILRARCQTCHRQDGDAPVPLETFEQVRRRGSLIAQLTSNGYMPPWKPAADSPPLIGERRLSTREKQVLTQWVAGGMPEGDGPSSSTRTDDDGWVQGAPDLIIRLPEYVLPAGSSDVFRNFVIRAPFAGTRYVRGLQFRPRSRAVHHANIRIDSTSASAALDAADPAPGYEGVILHSAQFPDGYFLGWTPGQAAPPDNQLAWPLQGQSDFVVQLHMRSTGQADVVRPLLGLYFSPAPPAKRPTMIRLGRQDLRIPAGDEDFKSTDSLKVPLPITVIAIQPHSHYRARDVLLRAELPDGTERTLLHIDEWDFYWQDQYRLAQPMTLPAGTTLRSTFRFDNSNRNPRNPSNPPADVAWGWRTSDEMADVWLQVVTGTDADRAQLSRLASRKATSEDAVGVETLIAREPDHFNLRNDAALIYQELNQPEKVLEHFQAARRLKPDQPATAFNAATALESAGRLADAGRAYRDAIALDASYRPARLRLAALLYRQGELTAAAAQYAGALALDPGNANVRCERARVLVEANRPAEARAEYDRALKVDRNNAGCLINATWLLSAHQDAGIRSSTEAVRLGERARDLARGAPAESAALDALAAAFAAADRFAEAVETAVEAEQLGQDESQRREIRERIALYRRGIPFRVITDRPK